MGNAMLLHATLIAIEGHVIHLLLVLSLQLFFLSDKPRLEILQLLLRPFSLLLSFLLVDLHRLIFLYQPMSFNLNCLILFLCLP